MLNVKTQMLNPYLKADKFDTRKRAFAFSLSIIALCNDLPNKRVFWIITDQLIRAITSIGANLVEAKSSSSRRDFIRFYDIALKSGNESEYWLWLLYELVDEATKEKIVELINELDQICRMIGKSLLTLKNKTD